MLCREVIKKIEEVYPKDYALCWDNVGLLAGRQDKEVKKIHLALDADDRAVKHAIEEGSDMLITHHPLIFSGIKKVTDEDFIGRRLVRLLQNDVSYYAMHTNYDVLSMAKSAAERMGMTECEVLEKTKEDPDIGKVFGIGLIGYVERQTAKKLCGILKSVFDLPGLVLFGDGQKEMHRIAICPGSGKSVIDVAAQKGADALVTGDIGHHEGIDAVAKGLCIIDVGHYGMEHIFVEDVKESLGRMFPELLIETEPIRYPYHIL